MHSAEGGSVVTFDPGQGGGRCCDAGQGGSVVTLARGGGGVVTFDPVEGGADLWCCPPPLVGQTDACENTTFARFAARVVIIKFKN